MRALSRFALLAAVSLVAVGPAPAQSRVVVPAVATDLPGNAAMFAITNALGGRLAASPNGPGVIRTAFDLSDGCA